MAVAERPAAVAAVDPRQLAERLEQAIAQSTADETELVWIERIEHRAQVGPPRPPAASSPGRPAESVITCSTLVRVIEAGRTGEYQTGRCSSGELANAIRQAVTHSRALPAPAFPARWADTDEKPSAQLTIPLYDDRLAQLSPPEARQWLEECAQPGESATLTWSEDRLMIVNSGGLQRRARSSTATVEVGCGVGPGSATARSSARSLEGLDLGALFERARSHCLQSSPGLRPRPTVETVDLCGVSTASQILLLSPEATGDLVWLLGQVGLSAAAFHNTPTRSRLAEWLGKPLFSRQILLVDDAPRHPALPFPFDLEGHWKRPVELIANGVLTTPAVDARLAFELGLTATPHSLGAGIAHPGHLILNPGTASPADLLAAAPGGIAIDRLERLESYDPPRLRFRAQASGLRRIEGGKLGPPLADAIWEDSLDRVFRDVAELGSSLVSQARAGGLPQGVSAPALLIAPPGVRHG